MRAEDVLARFGGEEFAILCRETDEHDATALADRVRSVVADRAVGPRTGLRFA